MRFHARFRSVLIEEIPFPLRSPEALRGNLERIYPADVAHVVIAQDLSALADLLKERTEVGQNGWYNYLFIVSVFICVCVCVCVCVF